MKNFLALYWWRLTQTQMLANPILWGLMLTGVFYNDYIYPNFKNWGLVQPDEFLLGFIYFFLIIFAVFSLSALAYDWSKFWKNQAYTRYKKDPAFRYFWLPLAKAINKKEQDAELEKGIELMEKWIRK